MKTAIEGGIVVFEDGAVPATVLIAEDGTIAGIVNAGEPAAASEVIDAAGLHVFPGAVDPHTHLNDPGSTASEDFYSGTCGAAAGGVTTCIEMPQTIPIVTDRERFLETTSQPSNIACANWLSSIPASASCWPTAAGLSQRRPNSSMKAESPPSCAISTAPRWPCCPSRS